MVAFVTILGAIICLIGAYVAIKALSGSIQEVRLVWAKKDDEEDEIIGSALHSTMGAVIAGMLSAAIVGSYGLGPMFLYLGPISAIACAIGVIWNFTTELKEQKKSRELAIQK